MKLYTSSSPPQPQSYLALSVSICGRNLEIYRAMGGDFISELMAGGGC